MTQDSIFHRNFRALPLPGVCIGIDVSEKGSRLAVAVCNIEDAFCKKTGKYILNTLFDQNDQTLRAMNLTRNVFWTPYIGKLSATEVIQPLLDFIADALNERAIFRVLRDLFLHDAVTEEKAKEASETYKNPRLLKMYKNVVGELSKRDVDLFAKLRTLDQFDRYFFDWRGSADAVIGKVRQFAQLMIEEMELLSEVKALAKMLADAKEQKDDADAAVSKDQIKAWEKELKALSKALARTKEATGAKRREKARESKPVATRTLPRETSAPARRKN